MKLPDKQHVNDVVTRWGSKHKMLDRVKELLPATNQIFLNDRKYRDLCVNWQDACAIDSILHVLKGFETLTDLLSADKEVTISSFISLMRHIHALTTIDANDDEISTGIKEVIREYIAKKLATHDGANDEELLMFLRVAEVLDPRYLSVSTSLELEAAQQWLNWPTFDKVKSAIIQNYKDIIEGRMDATEKDEMTNSATAVKPTPPKRRSLVGLLLSSQTHELTSGDVPEPIPTHQDLLRVELDFYIRLSADETVDILQWWRGHASELPLLSKLARYVFTACATSVPSERLFSLSGNIVSKKRNALKPHVVNQLVFLSFNSEMIC